MFITQLQKLCKLRELFFLYVFFTSLWYLNNSFSFHIPYTLQLVFIVMFYLSFTTLLSTMVINYESNLYWYIIYLPLCTNVFNSYSFWIWICCIHHKLINFIGSLKTHTKSIISWIPCVFLHTDVMHLKHTWCTYK
jgi:hypothetical protein